MSDEATRARLDAGVEFAKKAGASTLALFRSRSLSVDTKRDGSPVTAADRGAEEMLREMIAGAFPEDGVLGEEFGEKAGRSGYRWILDPIDGTRSFVCGVPLYGTLVGIEHNGRAVAGVLEMPALGERAWGGPGLGAKYQVGSGAAVDARVSGISTLRESVFVTTSSEVFTRSNARGVYDALESRCAVTRGWSDCYGALLVATARADVWVEPVMAIWDIAAIAPIIEAAGGRSTDWRGTPTHDCRRVAASNGKVHAECVEITRGVVD
jgi:histidinol-phosphatase